MRGKWLFAFQKLASNYNSHFQCISRFLSYLEKQKQESVLFLASFTYIYVNVQGLDLELLPKTPSKAFSFKLVWGQRREFGCWPKS